MVVLSLSTDRDILREGSEVRERMRWYGSIADELHIIVCVCTGQNSQFQITNFQQNFKTCPFGTSPVGRQISKNVWVYPAFSKLKIFSPFDVYKAAKRIIRDLKLEIRNSLITAQDPFETGLVGFLLKRKFKIPLQIQIHTDFLSPYFWKESLKNKVRVLLAKFLIPKADGFRVVSERIKKSLSASWRIKTSVLPVFVDVEKIRNTSVKTDLRKKYPEYDFIILMASRLTKEKNIGLAIEAMKEVIKQYPQTLFLIVGSGPRETNLRQMTNDLRLTDNVKFEKWTDDIISYYKTADLFLLTSNYEGYGMAAVEAAASGLPVVMTDTGISIGRIIPAGDARILTNVLNSLIQNKDEREELIRRQNKHFEGWQTKEEYLKQMKKLWQECFS